MVAFTSSFTPTEPLTRSKNRAGDFFWPVTDRAGFDRFGIETASGKNDRFSYDACRTPSLAQGGEHLPHLVNHTYREDRVIFRPSQTVLGALLEPIGGDLLVDLKLSIDGKRPLTSLLLAADEIETTGGVPPDGYSVRESGTKLLYKAESYFFWSGRGGGSSMMLPFAFPDGFIHRSYDQSGNLNIERTSSIDGRLGSLLNEAGINQDEVLSISSEIYLQWTWYEKTE